METRLGYQVTHRTKPSIYGTIVGDYGAHLFIAVGEKLTAPSHDHIVMDALGGKQMRGVEPGVDMWPRDKLTIHRYGRAFLRDDEGYEGRLSYKWRYGQ